ncbi:TrbC/VirB2 family protein [Escherichia coli]|uniref:TrbC/VirB2 family protein n=1 Tax=Escherichia coli TaxID=562 RepID=UPI0031F93C57
MLFTSFSGSLVSRIPGAVQPAITIIALIIGYIAIFSRQHASWITPLIIGIIIFIVAPYLPNWLA